MPALSLQRHEYLKCSGHDTGRYEGWTLRSNHIISSLNERQSVVPTAPSSSRLSWLLATATNDLHLVRLNVLRILHLEVDILDQESPDFITEPVGMKMTLL